MIGGKRRQGNVWSVSYNDVSDKCFISRIQNGNSRPRPLPLQVPLRRFGADGKSPWCSQTSQGPVKVIFFWQKAKGSVIGCRIRYTPRNHRCYRRQALAIIAIRIWIVCGIHNKPRHHQNRRMAGNGPGIASGGNSDQAGWKVWLALGNQLPPGQSCEVN